MWTIFLAGCLTPPAPGEPAPGITHLEDTGRPGDTADSGEFETTDTAVPTTTVLEGKGTAHVSTQGQGQQQDDGGRTADCEFWFQVEGVEQTEAGYAGTVTIGETVRNVTEGDTGVQFQALIAGPFELDVDGESVTMRFVGD